MSQDLTQQRSARRPGVAMLLSLISPGLGHVYCGQIGAGIVLMFVSLCLGALGSLALVPVAPGLRSVGWVAAAAGTALWLYAILASRGLARSRGVDYILKDYNRGYVYVLLVLLCLPLGIGFALYIRATAVTAFQMVGDSMSPAIHAGDRVLANRLVYDREPVRRGDIVVVLHPNRRYQRSIRRVAALAGDRVVIRDGQVVVNPPADGAAAGTQPGGPPTFVVPNGQCYLVADHAEGAEDSRQYAPVPLADIVGRVDYIYWPRWTKLNPQSQW